MAASEPRLLPLNSPSPQEEAEGAQAEPEQSPAGRQWEGPGSKLGAAAWKQPGLGWLGGQAGAHIRAPSPEGRPRTFCLNFPSFEVKTAFLFLQMGKQKVLLSYLKSTCLAQPQGPTKLPPWTYGF